MKVLLAFPMEDGQTGVFLKNAFVSCGCEVVVVDSLTHPEQIVEASGEHQPDLLFCSREVGLIDSVKQVREKYPKIKTACYNVDARHSVLEFGEKLLDLFNLFHIFYCKPTGNVIEYQKHCPDTVVIPLLEGIDQSIHKKETITVEDWEKYGCDVSFAGSKSDVYETPRPYGRIGLIDFLSKQDLDLRLISYNPVGSGRLFGSNHNKLCQCSKIVLGHCGWADIELANSARDFRIMGAGGFLLTEHVVGIENILKVGQECDTYRTKEECLEKIRYYLEHEEKRKNIAEAGYRRTLTDHIFENRVKRVLFDFWLLRR